MYIPVRTLYVHSIYVYILVYTMFKACWTLNTDFVRIWMQDTVTTVGAWVLYAVMLH